MSLGAISDEALLKDFLRGRRAALGELAGRYERRLLGLAWAMLDRNETLARDAVQEVWLRVIRFGAKFDGRSSFKTWLYRIAINQCRSLAATAEAGRDDSACDHRAASTDSPQQTVEAAERDEVLHAAVSALGPEKSETLLLCYHEGMTHAEAAELLSIPVGTLKSRLHAALEELRGRLSPEVRS
jgi:RNA polymerase sigma-70 factor (ECF subfamily)